MVTGDEGLCNWAAKKNPGTETVAVSHGIGGGSVSISPKLAVKRIEDAAKRALDKDISKLVLPLPDKFDIEICFKEHINAFKGSFYPGVTRTSTNTVCFHTNGLVRSAAHSVLHTVSDWEDVHMNKPKAVKPGDTLGLVGPSGAIRRTDDGLERAIKVLKDFGYDVKVGRKRGRALRVSVGHGRAARKRPRRP